MRAPSAGEGSAALTARLARRLAVLLAAGVPPAAAWRHLAAALAREPGVGARRAALDLAALARRAAGAAERGDDVAAALVAPLARTGAARRGAGARAGAGADAGARASGAGLAVPADAAPALRALAAAWAVAVRAGAPLAECLRDLASALRDVAALHRETEIALAGPRATARVVLVLPLVGLLFGGGLGFDTVHTLLATVPGWFCLAGGVTLLIAGARWNALLLARARRDDGTAGLVLDLMAVAMAGGGALADARALAEQSAARFGIDRAGESARVDAVLDLAERAGVPAAELLRAEAAEARDEAAADGRRRAETLAVSLMIPLGVCVLPAFLLLGVIPLILSVIGATLAGF